MKLLGILSFIMFFSLLSNHGYCMEGEDTLTEGSNQMAMQYLEMHGVENPEEASRPERINGKIISYEGEKIGLL
ncbi:MAG: hypothetical protein K2W94_04035 [Alphaproteobacteria bacterium]|nr:hypothetical protein [Alphaproteobacteria bacterium]